MTRLRIALAASALALAFGAGWQVNGWRLSAAWEAERVALAQDRARAAETELEARRAVEARLAALRKDYDDVQAQLAAIPDRPDCGLDAGRVRILDAIR